MMSVNVSDIASLNIKGSYSCCINLSQNADLTKNSEHYKVKNIKFFENI